MRWSLVFLSPFLAQAAIHPVFDSAPDTMKAQLNYAALAQPLGIRNDCNETEITYKNLEDLATSATVKNQQDFLDELNKKFPKAMQTFTLMYESQSAQADGISLAWPGVLRSTVDSKIIFRYVCNSAVTSVYNRVELIHYIEESQKEPARFELVELDFTKTKPKDRVHKNPSFCIDCHAAESDPYQIRPNWEMYADWKGVFGSHDDIFKFFDPNSALAAEKKTERTNFHKFINEKVLGNVEGGKPDPCYTALPWPEVIKTNVNYQTALPTEYANFPYGIEARSRNYTIRPNLKYTETLSHLQGAHNGSRLKFRLKKETPENAKKILLLLSLEAAKCDRLIKEPYSTDVLDHHLAQLLPKYQRPTLQEAVIPMLRGYPTPQHEPRHPLGMAQALYGASLALGFYPMDWTLLFVEYDRSDYEAGAGFGGTGLDDSPFPGVYDDYNRYLNAYGKKLPKDEKPEVADWVAKVGPGKWLRTYGDLPLTAYVQNDLFEQLAEHLPQLRNGFWKRGPLAANGVDPKNWDYTTTRAEEEWFGEGFACIDELGGALAFRSDETRENTCKLLRETAIAWGMEEGLPRGGTPKTRRGPALPRIPPTRLAAFHRFLEKRMPSKAARDTYIYSAAGLKEMKSKAFIDSLRKYDR